MEARCQVGASICMVGSLHLFCRTEEGGAAAAAALRDMEQRQYQSRSSRCDSILDTCTEHMNVWDASAVTVHVHACARATRTTIKINTQKNLAGLKIVSLTHM
jgi:hypothetical protein